jgi:flagellar motor protein MotB
LGDGFLRVCNRTFLPAAIFAAGFSFGCVSVRDYTQVRDQLRVEQRKSIERERRLRELESLAPRLRKKATVAELECAAALARLVATEKLLVLKPPRDIRPPALAPAPKTRPVSERGVLAGTITFAAGGDRLSDTDGERIAEIAGLIVERKGVRVRVEGHSDPAPIGRTQGRFGSNMHLSALRALAVYHELLGHEGVDSSRITVIGYGEHRPMPGRPETLRRVEIRLLPAEDASRAASPAGH